MQEPRNFWRFATGLVAIAALAVTPLFAADTSDQAKRAKQAAEVMTEVMNIPEDGIPDELMSKAQAIAVIPHVVKGAFGLGGQYGKGLVSQRMANGKWGTPSFINIGGGSFGFQLGVSATDLILVFTNKSGIEPLLKGKLQLGADASAVAGPVGRRTAVATDVLLKSGVFSYSRAKGLFAGVSLEGSGVTIDDSANEKVFGKGVTGEDILVAGKVAPNKIVQPFLDALTRYSPRVSE